MATVRDDNHFTKIYYFIVGLTFFGGLLTILLSFVPIAKGNERFADTGLIFWLSTAVSSGIGYLIGSSAKLSEKRKEEEEDPSATVSLKTGDTITIEK